MNKLERYKKAYATLNGQVDTLSGKSLILCYSDADRG